MKIVSVRNLLPPFKFLISAIDCLFTYSTYSTLNKLLDTYLYFSISIDFTVKVFVIQYEYCTRTLH